MTGRNNIPAMSCLNFRREPNLPYFLLVNFAYLPVHHFTCVKNPTINTQKPTVFADEALLMNPESINA
jgi:hypothetical protein